MCEDPVIFCSLIKSDKFISVWDALSNCLLNLAAILLNQKLSHKPFDQLPPHEILNLKKGNLALIVLKVHFLQKKIKEDETRKPSFTCIFLADWHDLVWSLEVISYCLRDARTQILVIMCTCSHCFNGCWSNHL